MIQFSVRFRFDLLVFRYYFVVYGVGFVIVVVVCIGQVVGGYSVIGVVVGESERLVGLGQGVGGVGEGQVGLRVAAWRGGGIEVGIGWVAFYLFVGDIFILFVDYIGFVQVAVVFVYFIFRFFEVGGVAVQSGVISSYLVRVEVFIVVRVLFCGLGMGEEMFQFFVSCGGSWIFEGIFLGFLGDFYIFLSFLLFLRYRFQGIRTFLSIRIGYCFCLFNFDVRGFIISGEYQ